MKGLVDAKRSFLFSIDNQDVKIAKRHDKNHCVIACALRDVLGISKVEVGARTVRVWNGGKVVRYMTPTYLTTALKNFDSTGKWNLPDGVYRLNPPPVSQTLEGKTIQRAAEQRKAHRRKYPAKRNNKMRQINPRVIEFAKIRKGQAVA